MQTLEQVKTTTNIVALWAAPRCISTAFLKTFSQRPDTTIIHEPFCNIYYFSQWRISNRFGDAKELHNYDAGEAMKKIMSPNSSLVFFKDMAYLALPYLDLQFLPSITNTFIIRSPREALASWYRGNEFPTEDEFGFTALEKMWQIVAEKLGQESLVVEGNRFRSQPEKILQRYCQNIGVEFDNKMLTWQEGRLQNWNKQEAEFHAIWHSTLDNSKGIIPPQQEEITIRPEDLAMVERAEAIYHKLSKFAL